MPTETPWNAPAPDEVIDELLSWLRGDGLETATADDVRAYAKRVYARLRPLWKDGDWPEPGREPFNEAWILAACVEDGDGDEYLALRTHVGRRIEARGNALRPLFDRPPAEGQAIPDPSSCEHRWNPSGTVAGRKYYVCAICDAGGEECESCSGDGEDRDGEPCPGCGGEEIVAVIRPPG